MAVSKVILNGTTLMDITDTTAEAADVAQGEYYYGANGVKTVGTSSGGGSTGWTALTISNFSNIDSDAVQVYSNGSLAYILLYGTIYDGIVSFEINALALAVTGNVYPILAGGGIINSAGASVYAEAYQASETSSSISLSCFDAAGDLISAESEISAAFILPLR